MDDKDIGHEEEAVFGREYGIGLEVGGTRPVGCGLVRRQL